jgi:16S rRNA (guanine527-N7)-methyltransferase
LSSTLKFSHFTKLLLSWNNTHNLTGLKTEAEIEKNIDDSIEPFKHIKKEYKNILDIGSGSGFPAIAIAILRPDTKITLTEPRIKRASFLHIVKSELELSNIEILNSRVEDINGSFDLITSRAVANIKMLLAMSKHLATDSTSYLFYKGSDVLDELKNFKNYEVIKNKKINYIYIKENPNKE